MNFLFFTIVFPFIGFIILTCFQKLLSKIFISIIGIGSVMLSALITIFIMIDFLNHVNIVNNNAFFFVQSFSNWISVNDFVIPIRLRIDGLSLNMLVMVTWISFLIHVYASWYMFEDTSYSLFFSYMNLFVASMILLILADNLLLMYFGWESVGLCSYLLINFYHSNFKNGEAALKAFIMTRIGDIFLICAMFMLYKHFHTLDFDKLIFVVSEKICFDYKYLNLITFCILVSAVAKSAQIPLQTWLSNAMVAPIPVSALIHAATMVTAGVYLIARTYSLFLMTPYILYLMGIIGSITLIISSFSALLQHDIKKILAYSTMGQISYMFLALSVQAKEEAVFHLTMHAFFKALLFLAAGSLIRIYRGEQNIFKMGCRLYESIPVVYYSFLVGGVSLSAVPIVTSGFYSKGDILWKILLSGNSLFILICIFGSFLTSLYTFRMIFVIFHSNNHTINKCTYCDSFAHYFPLLVLSAFSTLLGTWIKFPIFTKLSSVINFHSFSKLYFEFFLNILIIFGICISSLYYLFLYRIFVDKLLNCAIGKFFLKYCLNDWGFNWIYEKFFVQPYLFIARKLSLDPIRIVPNFIIYKINFFSEKLTLSENGQLHYYITSMIFGAVVILLILIVL